MFIFEDKILPYSNNAYKLNKFGEILDCNNKVFKTTLINNCICVEIDWVNGYTFYSVAVIISIIKFNIKIPAFLYKEIQPLYKDNDYTNISIENISYCFKNSPLEVIDLPGFYYIPFYTNYGISKDGVLINIQTKKIHSWSIIKGREKKNVKGGYFNSWAISDFSKSKNISRHRAIGLTFIKYDKDPLKLVINHKNGIPGDDNICNLEWCTKAENNKHAIDNGLMPNSVINILMKDLNTGQIKRFNSIADCARHIGKSHSFVYVRLKKQHVRYLDGLIFKLDDGSPWKHFIGKARSSTGGLPVIARNIFTDEKIIFDDTVTAGTMLGINSESIYKNIRKNKIFPIKGFDFSYFGDNINWPLYSKKDLMIFKKFPIRPSNGVNVLDCNGNEIGFFESLQLAADHFRVSYSSIKRAIKNKKLIQGKFFTLYKLKYCFVPL